MSRKAVPSVSFPECSCGSENVKPAYDRMLICRDCGIYFEDEEGPPDRYKARVRRMRHNDD